MSDRSRDIRSTVIALARDGVPPRHIHERLGRLVSIGLIYNTISVARRNGLAIARFSNGSRPAGGDCASRHVIRIHDDAAAALLDRHCARRRLSRQELIERLVATLLADDMVDAILDDEAGHA